MTTEERIKDAWPECFAVEENRDGTITVHYTVSVNTIGGLLILPMMFQLIRYMYPRLFNMARMGFHPVTEEGVGGREALRSEFFGDTILHKWMRFQRKPGRPRKSKRELMAHAMGAA